MRFGYANDRNICLTCKHGAIKEVSHETLGLVCNLEPSMKQKEKVGVKECDNYEKDEEDV